MKLLIAIPSHDYINVMFVECLLGLMKHLDEKHIDHDVKFKTGTLVHLARDEIVKDILYQDYTHVLWIDADMVFSPDIFDRLYEAGKSIVTAVCRGRHGKRMLAIFEDSKKPIRYEEVPKQLEEVDACGFACVLVEMKVLYDVFQRCGTCFTPTLRFGEDIAFCERAKEEGYSIYCEPKAICGHIAQEVIWP